MKHFPTEFIIFLFQINVPKAECQKRGRGMKVCVKTTYLPLTHLSRNTAKEDGFYISEYFKYGYIHYSIFLIRLRGWHGGAA